MKAIRKTFGIGFHKTATTSLGAALSILGYDVTGPFGIRDQDIATTARSRALEIARDHDAVQDNPWPLLFADLDEAFPGSRFVLTERDTDAWMHSVLGHFGGQSTPMREWIYGYGDPIGHEDVYRKRYEAHNEQVRSYFADRPGDLLVLRISDGDGWPELCRFLGVAVPTMPFPHVNHHIERTASRRISRYARRLVRRLQGTSGRFTNS